MHLSKRIFPPVFLLLIIIALAVYFNRTEQVADSNNSGDVSNVVDKVDSLIDTMQSDSRGETNVESNSGSGNKSDAESDDRATIVPGTPGLVEPQSNELDTTNELHGDALTMYRPEDSETNEAEGKLVEGSEGSAQSQLAVSREQMLHTWQQARTAAWYGDVESAIKYYQAVIALQPDNYNAYGEMGNVMLRAGDRDGAVEAYYQAARLLNKTPYRVMAWHLLNIIAGLSPPRAERLYQELMQH